MVNRLLRGRPVAPAHRVYARNTTSILQVIGRVELQPGDADWVDWPMARELAKAGTLEIIEYEAALVPSVEEQRAAAIAASADAPGFPCPECGLRWPTMAKMTGHMGSHNPAHGTPLGAVRSPKKKAAIERKERNRRYNTDYQRRRRARLKAERRERNDSAETDRSS